MRFTTSFTFDVGLAAGKRYMGMKSCAPVVMLMQTLMISAMYS
jgi:hypothetical protein